MSGSINEVTLLGNCGRDPEIRTTQSGTRNANFTIATSDRWRDRESGEQKEKTEWHRVVCYNEKLVEIIEKYITKGSKIWLRGTLQTRKWTDQKSGQDHYTTEVVIQAYGGQIILLACI
jgi:single-strand DNA-binding protein